MEKNSNDEELMSLIFGTTGKRDNTEETMLDLIDESLDSFLDKGVSDISQSNRVDDSSWSRRGLLNIVEEF